MREERDGHRGRSVASRPAASSDAGCWKRRTSRFERVLGRTRTPSQLELTLVGWSESASHRARPARCTWATRSARSRTATLPTSRGTSCCGSTTRTRRATSPGGEEAIVADLALARRRRGTRGRCARASAVRAPSRGRARDRLPDAEGALARATTLLRDGRHADLPARQRRRRPRLRDHARDPRQRPSRRTRSSIRAASGRSAPSRRSTSITACCSARTARSCRSAHGASSLATCAMPASRRRRCAPTSTSSGCRGTTCISTCRASRRLAIEAIGAMSDEELAARVGRARSVRARAARRPRPRRGARVRGARARAARP